MKKFIPILIASLFACWSCDLKDTYTQTNVRDMVNVEKGILFNDYGYVLNPVEDAVGADKWKIEGARFYAVYDILNRDLDIRLKEVYRSHFVEAEEVEDPEELSKDPLELDVQGISGGYINLGFVFTRLKNSNNAHVINFHYQMENNTLNLYAEHLGFNEDPLHEDEDNLVTEERMFSISTKDLPTFTGLTLVLNVIAKESGEYVIKQENYRLY